MLKNNGFEKPRKKHGQVVRCPYCKSKLIFEELQEEGNVLKISDVFVITCSECFEDFNM